LILLIFFSFQEILFSLAKVSAKVLIKFPDNLLHLLMRQRHITRVNYFDKKVRIGNGLSLVQILLLQVIKLK